MVVGTWTLPSQTSHYMLSTTWDHVLNMDLLSNWHLSDKWYKVIQVIQEDNVRIICELYVHIACALAMCTQQKLTAITLQNLCPSFVHQIEHWTPNITNTTMFRNVFKRLRKRNNSVKPAPPSSEPTSEPTPELPKTPAVEDKEAPVVVKEEALQSSPKCSEADSEANVISELAHIDKLCEVILLDDEDTLPPPPKRKKRSRRKLRNPAKYKLLDKKMALNLSRCRCGDKLLDCRC